MKFRRNSESPGTKALLSYKFNRMLVNLLPHVSTFNGPDSLSNAELDRLFDFQVSLPRPKEIGVGTLYITGIAYDERKGTKVVDKLVEIGVLKGKDRIVDTHAITRYFSHQLYMIPIYAQKRLVCLLFAWEEELMRWRMLEEEKKDLMIIISEERRHGGEYNVGHLEKRLMEIDGLWKLKPSLRRKRETTVQEVLPGYEEVRGSEGVPVA
jgi:hypothetical protein